MGTRKAGLQAAGGKPHITRKDLRPGVQAFHDASAEAERKKARVAELRARMVRR